MSDLPAVTDPRAGLPSASGLQRLALCPGSRRAEELTPIGAGASPDAELGTRLHKHLELGTSPEDESEREAVEWCRTRESSMAMTLLQSTHIHCRETRWWDRRKRFSGQADVVYNNLATGDVLIIDYKFGRGEVTPAEHNHQLAALALLALDNLPDVNNVYVCILQPYVSRHPNPRVWHKEHADSLRQAIYGILDAAEAPDAKLAPGDIQCKYCRAFATCPAVHLQLRTSSAAEITTEHWALLTPAQKAMAYEIALLAKRWSEKITAAAKEDLKSGQSIEGYTLGAPRQTFKISDPAGAFAALGELYPDEVTPETFTACCSVSVTALDKLIHAARKKSEKCTALQSKDWLRKTLADYGTYATSEPTITKIKPES